MEFVVVLFYLLFFLLLVLGAFKLYPLFFGSPYLASTDDRLKVMLKLAKVRPGEKVADLGAGNGKVVIAFAKIGAEAHGFEINPILVLLAKLQIRKLGLTNNAFMHWQDLWKTNYSDFDIITIYALPYVMRGLEKKLRKELNPKARIISNHFIFPNWKPEKNVGEIILYKKSGVV